MASGRAPVATTRTHQAHPIQGFPKTIQSHFTLVGGGRLLSACGIYNSHTRGRGGASKGPQIPSSFLAPSPSFLCPRPTHHLVRSGRTCSRGENEPRPLILRTAFTRPQHSETHHTGIDSSCLGRSRQHASLVVLHALLFFCLQQGGHARVGRMEQTCLGTSRCLVDFGIAAGHTPRMPFPFCAAEVLFDHEEKEEDRTQCVTTHSSPLPAHLCSRTPHNPPFHTTHYSTRTQAR